MNERLLDVMVFAVEAAIILGFVAGLRRIVGVPLNPNDFIKEAKELLRLKPSPEALNGFLMMIYTAMGLIVLISAIVAPWRELAVGLIGGIRGKEVPIFSIFGLVSGFWILAMFVSQLVCLAYKNRSR